MTSLLVIIIILACVVMGFFILIQKPKGGGLSGAFGSIGSQVMGVKQSGDAMEKGTWYTMLIIALLSIASTFTLGVKHNKPQKETPKTEQPAEAPAAAGQEAPAK